MNNSTFTKVLLAAAIISSAAAATAQSTGVTGSASMPTPSASQPTTGVGVTPQAAAEANRQAVPRSDTGTVVRTSPSATDAARSATGMTGGSTETGTGTGTGTTMRTPRADRN